MQHALGRVGPLSQEAATPTSCSRCASRGRRACAVPKRGAGTISVASCWSGMSSVEWAGRRWFKGAARDEGERERVQGDDLDFFEGLAVSAQDSS